MPAMTLRKLHWLIHGLCYSEMACRQPARAEEDTFRDFLAFERGRIARWDARVQAFPPDEALVILPWPHFDTGPAVDFEARAARLLGDRCFLLDAPYPSSPSFWQGAHPDFLRGVAEDLRDACLNQGSDWNKEEMTTALLSRSCARQMLGLMGSRGLAWDPATVQSEGWGASFEGCVSKYSGSLRRLLGLTHPIAIDFEMTVPDAAFLLRARRCERLSLSDRLDLFLFDLEGTPAGLYLQTSVSLSDRAAWLSVAAPPDRVRVLSKQGARLWPGPAEDKTPPRSIGLHEPAQELVTLEDGRLRVPISAGMVWRLAKSPAYLVGEPGTTLEEFRKWLLSISSTSTDVRTHFVAR